MKVNYNSMSDFEINKAVSMVVDFGDLACFVNDKREVVFISEVDGAYSMNPVGDFNPCNNPADAWPIIIENNISIHHEIARYKASSLVYDVKYERGFNIFVFNSVIGDTSSRAALRAAMIVFLMMNRENESG